MSCHLRTLPRTADLFPLPSCLFSPATQETYAMNYTVDSVLFDSAWGDLTAVFSKAGISVLLFGIYVNLFLLSIYTLTRRRGTLGKKFLITASCTMAVLGMTQTVVAVAQAVLTTHFVQEFVHQEESSDLDPKSVDILADIGHLLLAINVAVVDLFFMYRCYVVWGCQRKILIPPALLMLATLAAAIEVSLSHNIPGVVIPCGLAAATNTVLTALTAGRILWISRQSAHVGLSRTYQIQSRYSRAIRIILESGAIYCAAVIFLLIAASQGNFEVFDIGYAIGQQAVNIIPTFTLVYVGLQDTRDNPPTASSRKYSTV
ncbi:hypothetical protein MSAN_02104900 [Mycena sanguinolenta]|uniref:Uncharacterized protein n=1 Tax=Mycena sanguinolenta TaxID=230812 RepID=A0A8H6XGK3_9AGAR|nr:hypothetical protein MSAN_02104900 [Mycena sanguinolenta]